MNGNKVDYRRMQYLMPSWLFLVAIGLYSVSSSFCDTRIKFIRQNLLKSIRLPDKIYLAEHMSKCQDTRTFRCHAFYSSQLESYLFINAIFKHFAKFSLGFDIVLWYVGLLCKAKLPDWTFQTFQSTSQSSWVAKLYHQ